jgi:hypothetical protein
VIRARLCALGFAALSCHSDQRLREQQASAHICWVEERLRNAANPDKAAFLADLARSPCPSPAACALRDRCTAAYTLHVDGLKLTRVAKQQMQDGRGDEAARLLGAAETKLRQAGAEVTQCTELAAALRRNNFVSP